MSTPSRRLLAFATVAAAAAVAVGGSVHADSAGAAPARAAADPGFYGVAPTTSLSESDYQRLARANIDTVRLIFYWPQISAGPGKYNWLNVDPAVIYASAAGVRLVPTLLGAPSYVSNDPLRPPLDSAKEQKQWQDFVRALVARYGPGGDFWSYVHACRPNPGWCRPDVPYAPLRTWQVWNEPDQDRFWKPEPSPGEYARLLELTNDAVKGVDPGATVITGGVSAGGQGSSRSIPENDFLAALYQHGAAADFDGLDLHPYRPKPKQVLRAVKDARAVTRAYGDAATPLWITEVGWSTKGPKSEELVTSPKKQAKYLRTTMRKLTRAREPLKIELASWFTYLDGQRICRWCRGSGLFKKNGKPKPAWKSFVSLTGGQP